MTTNGCACPTDGVRPASGAAKYKKTTAPRFLSLSAAGGAVLGAVGGYTISRFALHRDPRWENVELRPKIRVGAMPVRGRGFGVAISVAF